MCVLYTGSHISCHGLKNLWKVIKVYRTPHEASKSAITDNLQRITYAVVCIDVHAYLWLSSSNKAKTSFIVRSSLLCRKMAQLMKILARAPGR